MGNVRGACCEMELEGLGVSGSDCRCWLVERELRSFEDGEREMGTNETGILKARDDFLGKRGRDDRV